MSGRRRIRDRLAALLGSALILAGCGSTPAVTPAGSAPAVSAPAASGAESEAPGSATFPPPDPESIVKAATAEVDLIHAMWAELGVATTVGTDGDAALAAVDDAEQAFGDAFLSAAAEAGAHDLAATGSVRLAAFTAASTDWAGGDLARGSSTISASLALGTEFLSFAEKGLNIPGYKKEETYGSTTGGTTESTKIASTLYLKAENGKLTVDVDQTSSSTLKQADNLVGLLNGTGKGHVDVGGCPDASGNIDGTIDVTISELWSAGGKTGTTDRKVTGTFTISANDAAGLAGVTAHMVTSGSGTNGAGGTWTAGGTASWGTGDAPTTTSSGATQAQVNQTTGAAAIVLFILANAASKAAEYWQSGKCVELVSNRESGEVKPEEEISLQIDAVSKVGDGPIKGPIVAQFSGKESLDKAGTPVEAPAGYQFKAGKDEGDVGTIQLEQRTKRGVGKKTLTFTVGGGLTFAASGNVSTVGFTLKISIPTTKLVQSGDLYKATVPVKVTGQFAYPDCTTKAVNFTSTADITVWVDAANPELVHVGAAPPLAMALQKITTICSKYPADFPSGPTAMTWFGIFVSSGVPATVTIGQPTTLTATKASGTVTIARAKPTQGHG